MSKIKLFTACASLLTQLALAHPASPVGNWTTYGPNKKPASIVQVKEVAGELEGTITKFFPKAGENANPVCKKCTGQFRDKPLIGMKIMWGLKPSQHQWSGGHILAVKKGKIINCTVKMRGNDALEVRAYINRFVGETDLWKRAAN